LEAKNGRVCRCDVNIKCESDFKFYKFPSKKFYKFVMLRFVWLSEEPRLELMAPEEPEALCGVAHVGYGLEF